jgi:molybdate transport system regulatory protein
MRDLSMVKTGLKLNYKFWIETDSGVSLLGEGKWQLLKAIKETGSLKAAVEKMGYSYRQTWENLKILEEKMGYALIEKHRGGEKGGQTILTFRGEKIVEFFDKLYLEIEPDIRNLFHKMMSDLDEIVE